jgi:NCK-associated protein 1
MVFSALALAQSEVVLYFQHVGVVSSKSTRGKTVDIVSHPFLICLEFSYSLP